MAETFPNMGKETDIKVHKAHGVPIKMNPKKSTPRHIIIEVSRVKDKERILKVEEKNNLFIQGIPHAYAQISQQ